MKRWGFGLAVEKSLRRVSISLRTITIEVYVALLRLMPGWYFGREQILFYEVLKMMCCIWIDTLFALLSHYVSKYNTLPFRDMFGPQLQASSFYNSCHYVMIIDTESNAIHRISHPHNPIHLSFIKETVSATYCELTVNRYKIKKFWQ